uniref:Uncharacterized protein n=1 Tax=Trichuris muris TaxID=70415 RepID=A0A5S6QK99_TRIMR
MAPGPQRREQRAPRFAGQPKGNCWAKISGGDQRAVEEGSGSAEEAGQRNGPTGTLRDRAVQSRQDATALDSKCHDLANTTLFSQLNR